MVLFFNSSSNTIFFSTGVVVPILWLLACPIIYSAFHLFYIMKNRQLQTYADILHFLDPKKNVKTSFLKELWFAISFLVAIFIIFFAGTVISALLIQVRELLALFFCYFSQKMLK